jgi:hypothetical protein
VEGVQARATDFWTAQTSNWNRIRDRIQEDQYSLGKWVSDAFQTWDTWMTGAMRFASLPVPGEGVVPTVVLLADGEEDEGPKGDVLAPADFDLDKGPIATTQFSSDEVDNTFTVSATPQKDTRIVSLAIVAKKAGSTFKEAFDSAKAIVPGTTASAVVYQAKRPLARVILSFISN